VEKINIFFTILNHTALSSSLKYYSRFHEIQIIIKKINLSWIKHDKIKRKTHAKGAPIKVSLCFHGNKNQNPTSNSASIKDKTYDQIKLPQQKKKQDCTIKKSAQESRSKTFQ
jgi:hypothetical protein